MSKSKIASIRVFVANDNAAFDHADYEQRSVILMLTEATFTQFNVYRQGGKGNFAMGDKFTGQTYDFTKKTAKKLSKNYHEPNAEEMALFCSDVQVG